MRQGQSNTMEHGYDNPNPFGIQQTVGAVREPPLQKPDTGRLKSPGQIVSRCWLTAVI